MQVPDSQVPQLVLGSKLAFMNWIWYLCYIWCLKGVLLCLYNKLTLVYPITLLYTYITTYTTQAKQADSMEKTRNTSSNPRASIVSPLSSHIPSLPPDTHLHLHAHPTQLAHQALRRRQLHDPRPELHCHCEYERALRHTDHGDSNPPTRQATSTTASQGDSHRDVLVGNLHHGLHHSQGVLLVEEPVDSQYRPELGKQGVFRRCHRRLVTGD